MANPPPNYSASFPYPHNATMAQYPNQQEAHYHSWWPAGAHQMNPQPGGVYDQADLSYDGNTSASPVASSMGDETWGHTVPQQTSPRMGGSQPEFVMDTRGAYGIAPRPQSAEQSGIYTPSMQDRAYSTSGKRRAQNRAAQRAFRERKQQHVKDLEQQLEELAERYEHLEQKHDELNTSYEKLKRAIGYVTQEELASKVDNLRQALDILDGGMKKPPA